MISSPVGAELTFNGRRYVNFGGSSYLGLACIPQITEAGIAALRNFGHGYQFPARYGLRCSGYLDAESEAERFFDAPAAMYLAGGYYFGWISVAAMRDRSHQIFYDELAHYSLREAIAASGLPSRSFRHLDAQDLEAQLKLYLHPGERPLVITDGMYSTFGEIAPLDELAMAMRSYGGRLIVDESHSFGVLGDSGRGACEHHHLSGSTVLIGGSTGKALGTLGGIILGSEEDVAAFRSTPAGRGAATGLPAAAAMFARSLKYIREHPELLHRLRKNVAYLKSGLRRVGLEVGDSIAPVVAFAADSEAATRALQERLFAEGIFVFHSTYIGAGPTGVIRCGIFADHTTEHLDRLLNALRRLL